MIKSLWACWIDESPQWNLICFQVVQSSVLCMSCNELNLHFLKIVDAAHNSQSHKDSGEAVVVLSQSVVLSNCCIYKKHGRLCDNLVIVTYNKAKCVQSCSKHCLSKQTVHDPNKGT